MFKFLKEKLKKTISAFSKKVEEEVEEAPQVEEKKEEAKPETPKAEEKKEEPKAEEKIEEVKEEKKGIFAKIKKAIVTKKLAEKHFEQLFDELEITLLENNVALDVIDKLRMDLRKSLVDQAVPRNKIAETVTKTLHHSIEELFAAEQINLIQKIKQKKPYVICFVGVNGSGKTTSIAKVAKLLQDKGLSVVFAAADTFRAAAIDQLEIHANNLKLKIIKHDYGADAAAVAFDAIKHAEATNKDVVLIDTAGRLHSNINLLNEMQKIVKVAKPDLNIFVGESITGNDCVEQAKKFNESIGIDGIILTKADIDEKGGAAISISYVTGKPIMYLGTGQEYNDLIKFEPKIVLESLGL